MNLFVQALKRQNLERPPVWFMRQAGRYHSHYQELKKRYTFEEICKLPEVACEATMGPMRDFDFDAAILFSDLLFPLEVMGMGLSYSPGPQLSWHLRSVEDLQKLVGGAHLVRNLQFQADALRLIRRALSPEKGLLGFVGGPLTLFFYAVEGSHQGELLSARQGLMDGRYDLFFERLYEILLENMKLQADAGADAVAVLDTCAGEVDPTLYREKIVPHLAILFEKFKKARPEKGLIYYSKKTTQEHLVHLEDLTLDGIGVDWNHLLAEVLNRWGDKWAIQGNIDPHWLFLPASELRDRLTAVFNSVLKLPHSKRQGWICGLGHGVMPKTPVENVRLFLRLQKEMFLQKENFSKELV